MFVDMDYRKTGSTGPLPKIDLSTEYPVIPRNLPEYARICSGVNEIITKLNAIDVKAISDQLQTTVGDIGGFFKKNYSALDESIKVELFAAAQSIRNNDMVYLPKPFETRSPMSITAGRWDPSHMVTDFLLRDLRKSNLFKGVFGYQQSGIGRFKVEGAVQQFAEVDEPDGWKAVLAVSVTLLDLDEPEVTKRVIFQKNYRQAEPMPEQNALGLAQGMSRAMEVISMHIINDLYKAAAARVCR